jgi:hypothetical protein
MSILNFTGGILDFSKKLDFIEGEDTYREYVNFIYRVLSDDKSFKSFKSNRLYTGILEHVSEELGNGYLIEINKYPQLPGTLWEKILINDTIGSPNMFMYEIPLGRKYISPTTLRYIKFSLDFLYKYKNNEKNENCDIPIDIIEIGGGYGGFCKIFLDISEFFQIQINSYTILDLDAPSKLCRKYLDTIEHGKCGSIITGTLEEVDISDKKDFIVLAFYSYSEISLDFRKIYLEKVISKSKQGFMCWNINMSNEDINKEIGKNIVVSPEIPLTGQFNRIISWNED